MASSLGCSPNKLSAGSRRRWTNASSAASGGLTQTIFGVELTDATRVIVRHLPWQIRGVDGQLHAGSEALACRVLADSGLPVPRLLAADVEGRVAGGPSTVTSWLPGRVRLNTHSPAAIRALAETAQRIHAVRLNDADRPRLFDSWLPEVLDVPRWASDPDLWRQALDLYHRGPPDTPHTFVHRDFHPGNILWQADAITGVIDWAEAAWGPVELDVAHCAANFALLHNLDNAIAFRQAYAEVGGRLDPDPAARAYWSVLDIFSFLPDPAPILQALRQARPDLTPELLQQRVESLLRFELAQLRTDTSRV